MSDSVLRLFAASALAVTLIFGAAPASAQSGDPKNGERTRQQTEKDNASKKAEELSDTSKATAGPAGNPECIWLGRRVVNLLWRDDLDTAFRHLDLYDRFGCPGNHIQAAFRCVVRQGNIDPKSPESLNARVDACWINPSIEASTAAAAPAGTPGTTAQ